MDLNITGRTAVVTGGNRGIGAAIIRALEAEVGGPVDILVNNAGTSANRPLDELTDAEWQAGWELHVMAPMRLMRHFAPEMAARGWGRIVNVTTSTAKRPSLTNASYAVTKVGEQALSRVFADFYAAQNVLVNAV